MFDIANVPFDNVPDAEKKTYEGKMLQVGSYQGYKLRNYWVFSSRLQSAYHKTHAPEQHIVNGVRDQIENYNSMSRICLLLLNSLI